MKKLLIVSTVIWLQSCYFGGNPEYYNRKLPGNLQLSAMDEKKNLALWELIEGTSGSYTEVIEPTIYEIGWTEDFIIAKTHPDLSNSVSDVGTSSYLTRSEIVTLIDSTYFIYGIIENHEDVSKYDSIDIYKKDGQLWHKLCKVDKNLSSPFKGMTYWHIVDIKNDNQRYYMTSEQEFLKTKVELNIPDTLSFFLKFDELK